MRGSRLRRYYVRKFRSQESPGATIVLLCGVLGRPGGPTAANSRPGFQPLLTTVSNSWRRMGFDSKHTHGCGCAGEEATHGCCTGRGGCAGRAGQRPGFCQRGGRSLDTPAGAASPDLQICLVSKMMPAVVFAWVSLSRSTSVCLPGRICLLGWACCHWWMMPGHLPAGWRITCDACRAQPWLVFCSRPKLASSPHSTPPALPAPGPCSVCEGAGTPYAALSRLACPCSSPLGTSAISRVANKHGCSLPR